MRRLILVCVALSLLVAAAPSLANEVTELVQAEESNEALALVQVKEDDKPKLDFGGGPNVASSIICFIVSAIAAAGGAGGGETHVPVYILVLKIDIRWAVPLSMAMIVGMSIMQLILYSTKKHPHVPHRYLIDFPLLSLWTPALLGGVSLGVLLHVSFPQWLTLLLLVSILSFFIVRMVQQTIAMFKAETLAQQKEAEELAAEQAADAETDALLKRENGKDSAETSVSKKSIDPPSVNSINSFNEHAPIIEHDHAHAHLHHKHVDLSKVPEEIRDEVEDTLEEEKTVWPYVMWILAMWILVSIFVIFRGGPDTPSVVGLPNCGVGYWLLTFFLFPVLLLITFVVARRTLSLEEKIKKFSDHIPQWDLTWKGKNVYVVPLAAFAAGTVAGVFGVGGGIIMMPLLLELKVHPQVVAATTAMSVALTSSSAMFQYAILGDLIWTYALWYGFLGLAAAALGHYLVFWAVMKYKRDSIILFAMLTLLTLAAVAILASGIIGIEHTIRTGGSLGFNPLCRQSSTASSFF